MDGLPRIESDFEIIHLNIPRGTNFDEINKILFENIKDEKSQSLGFSLDGYIASYFAIKFPFRLKRLFYAKLQHLQKLQILN